MSEVTRTFCDICGAEFTSSYWDHAPVRVQVIMSLPAQAYDSRDIEHVCRGCRDRIHDALRCPDRQAQ
jgi:uncharacterized protein (UPF0212 family)